MRSDSQPLPSPVSPQPATPATAATAVSDDRVLRTQRYYEHHGADYAARTRAMPMSHAYAHFLPLVRRGGRVLDAGCGSGRDSAALLSSGLQVVSSDLSTTLLRLTQEEAPQATLVRASHLAVPFRPGAFDGVWAHATLLHIPRERQHEVLTAYAELLAPDGVLFFSYKLGADDGPDADGRWFTHMTPDALRQIVREIPALRLVSLVTSPDVSRSGVTWLWCVAIRR